ncbi:histidine kinase [Bdellovibrio bacteriovorus]|uniref:histidine kinase n=1 Tax=Bdellovibrio bacteriovorus TaxID=959 RepID=A0A150WNT7_BDEBC|nr:HAMP domain-containing sensor histidine kinase [Bdellovibrio bacteriovorus]KYG66173.1 histidine kinase [Bdellovibrio bacteriovorus]
MPGLIRFRWIAIVSMCLGILPLLYWGFLPKRNILYFIAVIVLLALFNVIAQGLWPKEGPTRQKHILINLYIDLLAAAGLLFVSGSANNPFISILCIHAFLGGMLLRQKTSPIFGLTVLGLLGILQYETYLDAQTTLGTDDSELFLNFLSQWVLVGASWFVSHYFSRLLAKNEERIRVLQDRQHQADRLKALGALTAGFSHQLATPMNSLKLRMERGLRKLEGIDTSREEFEKAKVSLDECVSVFEHMASVFSRSSQAELQNVELERLVPDLLKVWEKENPTAVVEKMIMNESMPCRLQVLSFSHTFFDLLNNAQEALADTATVYLRLYKDNSWAYLEVTDRGTGLSEEILSRLGEPFVTSKVDGNGLGLYSASMMAQASGGEFKIFNNSSGKGATAQIRLPLED